MKTNSLDLSIVIPVFNEEDSVKPLIKDLCDVLMQMPVNYETIIVDDGSTDNTLINILDLQEKYKYLKVIRLQKNYGQTIALHAGFSNAQGEIIVTMDGDLQNDPADIPALYHRARQGYDLVLGWRKNRKDNLLLRTIPSRVANWLINRLLGVAIKDNGCALRAYRRKVVQMIPMYSEMHRLLPTIISLAGGKFDQIEVRHHQRKYGRSKYGLSRVYKVLSDLIMLKVVLSSTHKPLFGFGSIAFISFIISVLVILLGTFEFFIHPDQFSMVIIFGASILFFSLGLFLVFAGQISDLTNQLGDIKISEIV